MATKKNNPIANAFRMLALAIEESNQDLIEKIIKQLRDEDNVIVVLPVQVAS